ncbi:hypothetical protein ASPWEDRAFT_481722 [Aspergillus wentii DTO 134E9]|uniref:Uncharacterized protein n=1 Tax=Aspergillus wentii DTO 134E9 TaxID=1073089 RepID=A0A1L9RIX5_ASPWE|nr:uncharacterized protein ASPWEDRAFT_481722 [Aspergillus wentii DTO 134E9]OJJ34875.1 hypothetical protein ASPWEDRAFT_481722 [Aspergillus wentii DTO 134E9]
MNHESDQQRFAHIFPVKPTGPILSILQTTFGMYRLSTDYFTRIRNTPRDLPIVGSTFWSMSFEGSLLPLPCTVALVAFEPIQGPGQAAPTLFLYHRLPQTNNLPAHLHDQDVERNKEKNIYNPDTGTGYNAPQSRPPQYWASPACVCSHDKQKNRRSVTMTDRRGQSPG